MANRGGAGYEAGVRPGTRSALNASAYLLVALSACTPAVGDSCNDSSDCSVTGDRICDVAQPGGYCTVLNCQPDTCPRGSVCVEWRGTPDRTAVSYCMDACGRRQRPDQGDCRNGYTCRWLDDPNDRLFGPDGEPLARITDLVNDRDQFPICVADDPELDGIEDGEDTGGGRFVDMGAATP